MQQTMREVLRAVATLSGVELPGLPSGLKDDDAPPPRLDIKNLKDRFRNDLEGFSIRTTEELAKRAREQTQAALEAVQNEMGGRIEQVATEFRDQMQMPAQVEKLLEPCVEEAATRLENTLSQKVEHLVAEHGQLVQEKLQGMLSSVLGQISALEQAVEQVRELKSHSAAHLPPEPPAVAASVDRTGQIAAEEAAARLEKTLTQKVEQIVTEHEQLVQDRIQGALSSVQGQISTLEQTVQQIRELKAQAVAQPPAEQPVVAATVDRTGQIAAEEAAARLEKTLTQKVEQIVTEHEQLVQDRIQGALSSVQGQICTLEQTVQQIRELKAQAVAQPSVEQPVVVADHAAKAPETNPNTGFNNFLDQAFSRIQSSLNNFAETPVMPLPQGPGIGLKDLRNQIPFSAADIQQRRVEQALDNLERLGTKNPPVVS